MSERSTAPRRPWIVTAYFSAWRSDGDALTSTFATQREADAEAARLAPRAVSVDVYNEDASDGRPRGM